MIRPEKECEWPFYLKAGLLDAQKPPAFTGGSAKSQR
jgi:hypothetical protein